MKQRAIIVKLQIDEAIDINEIAQDIREDLESDGYSVISVQPWQTQEETIGQIGSLLDPNPTEESAPGLGVPGVGGLT